MSEQMTEISGTASVFTCFNLFLSRVYPLVTIRHRFLPLSTDIKDIVSFLCLTDESEGDYFWRSYQPFTLGNLYDKVVPRHSIFIEQFIFSVSVSKFFFIRYDWRIVWFLNNSLNIIIVNNSKLFRKEE